MSAPGPVSGAVARRPALPRWVLLLLKIGVTGAALAWAVSRTSFSAMSHAVESLSLRAIAISVGLLLVNVVVGALRWRAVIGAYHGARVPRLPFLVHGYLVASFYNTFVPGNVGGDALRAHAARGAFGHPADSFATIAIERGLGLGALLVLGGLGVGLHPGVPPWIGAGLALLGALLAVIAVASPGIAFRLLEWIPQRFASKMPKFSVPTGHSALGVAFLWSVVSQYLGVLSSHVLVADLVPSVTAVDSLAVVPLALLSLYVPVSVAGLGVREAAFVVLFGRLGVAPADATAASLAFMATLMIAALFGAVAHALFPLAGPLDTAPRREPAHRG